MISGAEKFLLYVLTNEFLMSHIESASDETAATLIAAILIAESADVCPSSNGCLEIMLVTSELIMPNPIKDLMHLLVSACALIKSKCKKIDQWTCVNCAW